MSTLSAIAVFCGSKPGVDPRHAETARAFGAEMARRRIELVYGGGRIGLMGTVADAVRAGGGRVTEIIPEFLMKLEVGNTDVDELEVTDSMHTRKRRMFDLADAFVTLAGGLGTLDETVEIITWKQLKLHDKPIVVISDSGYWDAFPQLLEHFVGEGFANTHDPSLYTLVDGVDAAFRVLEAMPPATTAARSERL